MSLTYVKWLIIYNYPIKDALKILLYNKSAVYPC